MKTNFLKKRTEASRFKMEDFAEERVPSPDDLEICEDAIVCLFVEGLAVGGCVEEKMVEHFVPATSTAVNVCESAFVSQCFAD